MEPERWPQTVRETVAELTCPRCGERRNGRRGIFTLVRFMPEITTWNIQCECWNCSQSWFWNLNPTGPNGTEALTPLCAECHQLHGPAACHSSMGIALTIPADKPEQTAEPVPLPAWVLKLGDLPPS